MFNTCYYLYLNHMLNTWPFYIAFIGFPWSNQLASLVILMLKKLLGIKKNDVEFLNKNIKTHVFHLTEGSQTPPPHLAKKRQFQA